MMKTSMSGILVRDEEVIPHCKDVDVAVGEKSERRGMKELGTRSAIRPIVLVQS